MNILREVAVDAVHPLFQVDVEQVDGDPVPVHRRRGSLAPLLNAILLFQGLGQTDRRHELLGGRLADEPSLMVEGIPLAILLEDRAEDPAVAVEVGELGFLRFRIELGDPFEEPRVGPEAPSSGLVGVRELGLGELLGGRLVLMRRVHQGPVGLLVPPGVPQVAIHDAGAGVDVADDALARRHPRGEPVLDRMPLLVLGDRRVGVLRQSQVACSRVGARVHGRAIIGINDMAGGAAARAIIARVVVGPSGSSGSGRGVGSWSGPRRLDRSGSVCPGLARAEPGARPPRLFERVGHADFGRVPAPRSKIRRRLPG